MIEKLLREKYSSLSKGQKKVADLLLKDVATFSMSTASQIAKQVDVSETTVIRLSYALDFESFSQMQKAIQREYFLKREDSIEECEEKEEQIDFIERIVKKDIEILQSIRGSLNMEEYWGAIHEIMNADEVKIVGFRASYSAASWLHQRLYMLRDNVEIVSTSLTTYPDNLLIDEDKKIVFIFISFPSYVAESLQIAQMVKKQGAKLITITDRLLSPISRISHISFTVQISAESENLIPISSILSLLNILTAGIEKEYGEDVVKRVQKLKRIYKDTAYLLE